MGLDSVAPFEAEKKIIEYHFTPAAPLMAMPVTRFVDEVSTESPAPGGGSVAALMGSLAAALATMVANLTVGKKGYEGAWPALAELAEQGQAIKAKLVRAVDEDTDAFNRVMDAMRLPKGTPGAERGARSRHRGRQQGRGRGAAADGAAVPRGDPARGRRGAPGQPELGVGCGRGGAGGTRRRRRRGRSTS